MAYFRDASYIDAAQTQGGSGRGKAVLAVQGCLIMTGSCIACHTDAKQQEHVIQEPNLLYTV